MVGNKFGTGFFVLVLLLAPRSVLARENIIEFDIPAQSVQTALVRFSEQSGILLLIPSGKFSEKISNAVSGSYTADAALAKMLRGTGIEANINNDTGQMIVNSRKNIAEEGSMGAKNKVRGLLASAIATVIANAASAQGNNATVQDAEQENQSTVQEIAVTGSRITRDGMSTPTPVTVMDTDSLSLLNPDQLIDSLQQLPQLFNSARPDNAGAYGRGSNGSSQINMRGLGSNRTLVLLNGKRVVSSSKLGAVDINLFPESMIQRIEIVTGGASAAYGSDAVTGVANFILDTDFTGIDSQVQMGITDRWDRETREFSLALGRDFGRLHVQASLEYFHSDSLAGYDDRDWYQDWAVLNNPGRNGPAQITRPNVGSTIYTHGGLITGGPLQGLQFLPDGSVAPFNAGSEVSGTSGAGGDGVNVDRQNEIFPEVERKVGFIYADYDISANTTVSVQGIFGRNDVPYKVSEMVLYRPATEATIFADNAFLPESLRQQMLAEGVDSFPFGRYSSLEDWQDTEGTKNDTDSYTLGLEHDFNSGWHLSGYYQSGETERINASQTVRMDRVFRALDSVVSPTGKIVCRSTLSNPGDGCIPLNLFGIGQADPAAADYLMGWRIGTSVVEQEVAELVIDGELFAGWGPGPVLAAVGVSWRKESLDAGYTDEAGIPAMIPPDDEVGYRGLPSNMDNATDVFVNSEMLVAEGGYSVKEVFAEVVLPVLADKAYARDLGVNASVRYADYSGSGGVLAWKGGIDWQVNNALRLRLTSSRDTRAANLGERFDFLHDPITEIDDPWAGATAVNPVNGADVGGNPEVDPELSDTITWGFVYQPDWLPGFSFSVDQYKVEIKDVIAQLGNQTIVDECFNRNAYCYLLTRDPETGHVLSVNNTFQNLDQATVEGFDLEAGYNWDLSVGGNIDIRFLAGHMSENSLTDAFGNKIERAGEGVLTKWTATTSARYSNGPFSLGLSSRYIGSAKLDLDDVEGVDIDENDIDSRTYFNLQAAYVLDNIEGGELNLFINIQNLLDKDPPWAGSTLSTWAGSAYTNSNFDRLGRRFTVGMSYRY